MARKLLICIGVISLLFIFELCISLGNYHEHYKEPYPEEQKKEEKHGPFTSGLIVSYVFRPLGHFLHSSHEEVIAASTFLILLFTAALAIYTGKLWGTTQNMMERADETARRHERAYAFGGPGPISKEGLVSTSIQLTNFGRTPAFLKECRWGIRSIEGLPAIPEYTEKTVSGSVILPHETITVEKLIPLDFTYFDLVIFGLFVYEDIAKETHTSRFIVKIDVDTFMHPFGVKTIAVEGYEKYKEWD